MVLLSSRCKIHMTTSRWIIITMTLMLMRIGESMRLDLESGMTKCISDDIKLNYMTVGTYTVVNPNEAHHLPASHKIHVTVSFITSSSTSLSSSLTSSSFISFSSSIGSSNSSPLLPDSLRFADFTRNLSIEPCIDFTNASTLSFFMLEVEVRKLLDTTESIHDEMFELREREREMQELNRSTNSRMAALSLISLVFTLSVAGLQLWHLKSFLERKKLL
ncbi:hypothetical protein Bca52824_071137 [Brassica carinata]|uniref:GOLD domain-containing protein n=1 Tax=Brassica carinata TaxID=52824 RepID=A0A8X7Q6S7_BRACI|nr:hypothetical protein Bca52824_071137 [Brassica carinata]